MADMKLDAVQAWAYRTLHTLYALGLYQEGTGSPAFIREGAWHALRRVAGDEAPRGEELAEALRAVRDMQPDSPWLGEGDFTEKPF
jgi:hypothetical protein